MAVTLERAKARVYFLGDTYPIRGDIKALGGHWDGDRRAWWVGAAKLAQAEALVASIGATPTRESAALADSVGLRPEAPAGMVTDKLREEGRDADADAIARPREDPGAIRLSGKGRYKGRDYYLGATTRDGRRVRLLTLPDAQGAYLDFWADAAAVEVTKTYQPREVTYGYGRLRRTEHTTLGSIARFVARQRDPATRRGCCTECGSYGPVGLPCRDCGGEGSYA